MTFVQAEIFIERPSLLHKLQLQLLKIGTETRFQKGINVCVYPVIDFVSLIIGEDGVIGIHVDRHQAVNHYGKFEDLSGAYSHTVIIEGWPLVKSKK